MRDDGYFDLDYWYEQFWSLFTSSSAQPGVIDLVGSFDPVINLIGSAKATIDLVGAETERD